MPAQFASARQELRAPDLLPVSVGLLSGERRLFESPACSPVSRSCSMKSRLTFSAKSCRGALRETWKYADSDAVRQLSYQRPCRPPTKTGFQSWLQNKSAGTRAEYSCRFQ